MKLENVAFLPSIPHHGLVTYRAQATRMRRTARSTLDSDTILLPSDGEELQNQ
ncbi:unnamed protein product, partial [Prorocentrum cordatum]